MAILLLALLPLYFLPEGIRAIVEKHPWADILYFSSGVLILTVAYIFARSPYPRMGARLTMLYFTFIPFATLAVQPERYAGEAAKDALIWSLPIMIMALILMTPKQIKFVVFFQIGVYLIIPAIWEGLSYNQVFSTLWVIIGVGGLMIVSAFVQGRYLLKAEDEAIQSKKNERRFREIFLDSPIALWEMDFSKLKKRLDTIAAKHGDDIKSYILKNPSAMEGAASSVVLLDANFSALELYETEDLEILKKSLHVVTNSRAMLALRDGAISLWSGVRNMPIETVHNTLQGNAKNVVVRFSVGKRYKDTWERIIVSVVDITRRSIAEANARQLASAVEASASSIVITDMDGAIEYVNPAFSQVTGYSREEAIGENPRVLKSGQHPASFYQEMWEVLSRGEIWRGEIINKKKNEELYWEHASISPLENELGEIVSYVAVKDDITQAKEAERDLRNLSSATEQSASAVVIADMNGLVEYVNPAFAKITGYSQEEVLGQTLGVLRSGEHDQNFYDEHDAIVTRGEVWRGEVMNKRKDGSLYWESQVMSPVKNDAGLITHYVSVRDDITAHIAAEKEIQRQGEFLQNIIDGIDSPFYVLNVDDYSIALANKKARKLGVTRGNTCHKLTHKRDTPCSSEEHPCPLKHVLQHKEAYIVEHIHYRPDGTPYYVEVHGYPIFDENDNVVQMIEYSIDITARKEAEEELRKLSSATQQAASGIVITNTKGIIEFANPATLKITGYSAEEFIGATPNLLKSGEHEASFYNELWETIQKGEVWRGDLINRRKDGSLYWESQTISPVKNNQGEITHYVAIKEDISKAKEAEKEIRTLSSATEQTANGIVIVSAEGKVEYTNPAFTEISGYSQDDVMGKDIENLLRSGEHDEEFYEQLAETISAGEVWKGEIINKRKDGKLYWEALLISPIKDENGKITHRVEVKEDITRRKELEQALAIAHEEALVASEMKTQLLANVSHDMRTPLGAILGYTEMLDTGVFEPLNDQQAEATRAIAASSQRLLNFVSDLLNQAQIETGEIILNESFIKPQQLLDGLGGEISLARTQGLILETKIGEKLPSKFIGDAYWLGQIVHNLLSNAIKFTPRGGEINIRLLRSGEHAWKIEVADNGRGIPPEAQNYIFESFRQVDGSITREAHTGSGLGLSIVNHLVRLMGGEIQLESTVGKGSTFTILLPLQKDEEKKA